MEERIKGGLSDQPNDGGLGSNLIRLESRKGWRLCAWRLGEFDLARCLASLLALALDPSFHGGAGGLQISWVVPPCARLLSQLCVCGAWFEGQGLVDHSIVLSIVIEWCEESTTATMTTTVGMPNSDSWIDVAFGRDEHGDNRRDRGDRGRAKS